MSSGWLMKKYLQLKAQHKTKTAKRILPSKRSENRQLKKKRKGKKKVKDTDLIPD